MRICFINADGERIEANGEVGMTLLELAQSVGLPLEGTCEGQMACSTCHVIVEDVWFDSLPEASADEEDMLDLAAGVAGTSRLGCQVTLTEAMDGLTLHIPRSFNNMQVR